IHKIIRKSNKMHHSHIGRHAKIAQMKKRVAKCKKRYQKQREELMVLQLRNRIKQFIIEDMERRLQK
ncbi:hypothetical protein KR018_000631, partial [Drosophila ironensis]